MEIIRCSNGHFYDSEENRTCPVCAAGGSGRTGLVDNILPTDAFREQKNTAGVDGVLPTDYYRKSSNHGIQPTEDARKVQKYSQTVSSDKPKVQKYDHTKPTPLYKDATEGFDPVVGWLVCIEGASKGKDFKIHNQNNFIGRGSKADISIPDDPCISEENAAVLNYDNPNRSFYFAPGMGRNSVRRNGELVLQTIMLQAYDVLTIGETKLLFVPLCGSQFTWNEE